MHRLKTHFTLLITFILLSISSLTASEVSAHDIVAKAFKHISSLKSYAFDATISEKEAQEDGSFVTYNYTSAVTVNRPNQLRIDAKGKYFDKTLTIDNGLYTVMRHSENTYSQLNVPKDIDHAIETILDKYSLKKAPLASLVYNDISTHVKISKGEYIGEVSLNAVKCEHLRFVKDKRTIDVWVTKSSIPHIISYEINDKTEQPFELTRTNIIWKDTLKVSPNKFHFQIAKTSKKTEIMTENSEG